MPLTINTNVASLTSQRNLARSQSELGVSLQRLSSGLRINSAKDDAAGLAISERFTTQIRGLNQATRNANDAISLSQTAEGALGEYGNILQRVRELALQSANSTNSSSDRQALNSEVQQQLAELNRISTQTQFNGQNVLDGSFTSSQFQVGANANQTISVSIGNASTDALGAYQFSNTSSPVTGAALTSGQLTINSVNVGTSADGSADAIVNSINAVTNQTAVTATATSSITATNAPTGRVSLQSGDLVINGVNIGAVTGDYNLATQGSNIATAINNRTATTGVTATANTTTGALTLSSSVGETIAITSTNTTAGAARIENATGLELSTNGNTAVTTLALAGTKATNALDFEAFGTISDGDTFTIGSGTSATTFEFQSGLVTGNLTGANTVIGAGYEVNQAGLRTQITAAINDATNGAVDNVAVDSGGGNVVNLTADAFGVQTVANQSVDSANVSGTALTGETVVLGTGIVEGATAIVDGETYTFVRTASTGNSISLTDSSIDNVATALRAAINVDHTGNTSDVVATGATNNVILTADVFGTPGNSVVDTTGTSVGVGVTETATTAGTDGAYTASTTYGTISLSSSSSYQVGGTNSSVAGLSTASSTLTAINTIDISSVTGANNAISLIDGALDQVNSIRGDLGAVQNRFESTIASLTITSENLSAARSRIRDADFAAETASLTRLQILQQAGVSILSQANSLPQLALSLLQ
ncbi:Flagellin protein FlaA [hydrothermal vent metagenome]|uniref:Flagellin protein FlaA n=1 Tax=hydrothermal vent metagenome TaxID=652676 RepID=A0A3B0YB06_9ZZZZ